MPVTKQTYTATAPYTASQLATQMQQALIDAGLMSAWHDSFVNNSIENRVLEIVYDNSKTYGKTYYWFMFSGASLFFHICSGWNLSTDAPVGTQYLDFVSSATNTTSNHMRFASFNNNVTTTITRYTSELDSGFSWFVVRNGTTVFNFHISKSPPNPLMVDLSKVIYPALLWLQPDGNTLRFRRFPPTIRRDHLGAGLIGMDGFGAAGFGGQGNESPPWSNTYADAMLRGYAYSFPNANTNTGGVSPGSVILPIGFSSGNPAYSTNYLPIFTGVHLTPYSPASLPADFGLSAIFAANNLDLFSLIVVSAQEVWDVLAVRNGPTLGVDPTIVLLARST